MMQCPDAGTNRAKRRLTYAGALIAVAGLALGVAWLMRRDPLADRAQPKNVLLIILDSMRTDRLGAYGSTRGLTPFLDRFAAGSVVYERAYAASSWTVPSVASLFLATYPIEHQVSKFFAKLPAERVTLAEVFKTNGFITASITANAATQPDAGFSRGFDRWELVGKGTQTFVSPKSDGRLLNEAVLAWRNEADPSVPFFGYLHFMDAHSPYRAHEGITPPPPAGVATTDQTLNLRVVTAGWDKTEEERTKKWAFTSVELRRLEDLYDGEVRYSDNCLAELLAALEARGDLNETLVIITADHGEDFGEHGTFGHGTSLFQATVQVPLIIRFPGQRRGTRIATPTEIGGLGPAILQELRIEAPSQFRIAPVPFGDGDGAAARERYAYSELGESQIKLRLHQEAIIASDAKLLIAPGGAGVSYDLRNDPLERAPLAQPDERLRAALSNVRSGVQATERAQGEAPIDETTRQRLRDLGYFPDAE